MYMKKDGQCIQCGKFDLPVFEKDGWKECDESEYKKPAPVVKIKAEPQPQSAPAKKAVAVEKKPGKMSNPRKKNSK